jgi:TRAP-type C4-dicarboxylate transport system permease small subunit
MAEKIISGVKRFTKILGYIAGALVLCSAFVMLYDVILRYAFSTPSLRAPFIAAYLMLAAIFSGTSYALWHGGHVSVDLLVVRLKPMARKICVTAGYIFSLIFLYYLTRACFNFAVTAATDGWRAMGHFPIPMVYLYGIMVFGLALLLISILCKIIEVWFKKEVNP